MLTKRSTKNVVNLTQHMKSLICCGAKENRVKENGIKNVRSYEQRDHFDQSSSQFEDQETFTFREKLISEAVLACRPNIGNTESPDKAIFSPRDSKKKKVLRKPPKAMREFADNEDTYLNKASQGRDERNPRVKEEALHQEHEQNRDYNSRSLSPKGFNYSAKYKALNRTSPSNSRLDMSNKLLLPRNMKNVTYQKPFQPVGRTQLGDGAFILEKAVGGSEMLGNFAREKFEGRKVFSDQWNPFPENAHNPLKRNYAYISRSEQPSNSQRDEEEIIMSLKKIKISNDARERTELKEKRVQLKPLPGWNSQPQPDPSGLWGKLKNSLGWLSKIKDKINDIGGFFSGKASQADEKEQD